jgi:uncharacterized protein YkwD
MSGRSAATHTTSRTRVLLVAAMVAGCTAMAGRAPGGSAPLAAGHRGCPEASTAAVVSEVNAARRRAKLGPLATDARLARVARGRSAAMAARGKLSHRGWERALREGGVKGDYLAENVAYNYPTASAVVRSWLTSRGHRANILSPKFRRIGVGCVIDADGRRWWTQEFEG